MFCFGILSRFDLNMMTTAKKVIKESPYKWAPEIPLIFYKFLIFFLYNMYRKLTMQAKFHEVAKYFIQQNGIATTLWEPN